MMIKYVPDFENERVVAHYQQVCQPVTYDPSASISAHVTVDLQGLVLISTQVDGVHA